MMPVVFVSAGLPSSATFEMPKSSTFTHAEPSGRRERKRFDGLRSRCTMPARWASAIASQASMT
jgi:hypothetical protein